MQKYFVFWTVVTILFFTCFSVNCSILFKVTIKAQLDSSQHTPAETKLLLRLQHRGQRGVRDCRTNEPFMPWGSLSTVSSHILPWRATTGTNKLIGAKSKQRENFFSAKLGQTPLSWLAKCRLCHVCQRVSSFTDVVGWMYSVKFEALLKKTNTDA